MSDATKRLRELVEAASPGPLRWYALPSPNNVRQPHVIRDNGDILVAEYSGKYRDADVELGTLAPTLALQLANVMEVLEWALGHVEDERPAFFATGRPGADARQALAEAERALEGLG